MRKIELVAFLASDVLYHVLKKIGKATNADHFQFMKEPAHQRTEEEIKFIFRLGLFSNEICVISMFFACVMRIRGVPQL